MPADPALDRKLGGRMCLTAAIGCAVVSVLPNTPVYPMLYTIMPLFRAVRVQAHIEQIVLLMIAVLAGFGVAGLGRRWRNARTWPAMAMALGLLVNLEALRASIGYKLFSEIPRVYDVLSEQPDAASIAALRARGVTNVVVHEEMFSGMLGRDRWTAIGRTRSLELIAGSGDINICRLRTMTP